MIKGDRLKLLRERHNLSAQELADHLGIGVAQVFRYEAEKTDPTTGTLIKIAKFFHVSVDYLVGLANEPDPIDPATHLDFDWGSATLGEIMVVKYMRRREFFDAIQVILLVRQGRTLSFMDFDHTDLDDSST